MVMEAMLPASRGDGRGDRGSTPGCPKLSASRKQSLCGALGGPQAMAPDAEAVCRLQEAPSQWPRGGAGGARPDLPGSPSSCIPAEAEPSWAPLDSPLWPLGDLPSCPQRRRVLFPYPDLSRQGCCRAQGSETWRGLGEGWLVKEEKKGRGTAGCKCLLGDGTWA